MQEAIKIPETNGKKSIGLWFCNVAGCFLVVISILLPLIYLKISFNAKLARMEVDWLSMRMNSCAEFFM